jgi:hypothetical protein
MIIRYLIISLLLKYGTNGIILIFLVAFYFLLPSLLETLRYAINQYILSKQLKLFYVLIC